MKYVDSMNRPRTESLFVEMISPQVAEKYAPVYTMREKARHGCPSAYEIYMDSANEYEAAMKLVGSMRHWRRLCGLKWFMEGDDEKAFDGVKQWREDKALKDQAEQIKLLREQAEGGSVTAQKILLEATGGKKKVGRPTKQPDTAADKEREKRIIDLHKRIKDKK
jgi:hypothetical protein